LLERAGGRTRVAGVITGVLMVGVLFALGPLLDATPLPALSGLLLVVAYDLVDVEKIRRTVKASPADAIAFVATMIGTWVVPLDKAIYIGIAISLVLFLRNARLLGVRELCVASTGRLVERPLGQPACDDRVCPQIRMLHVEGSLFFGAAGELQAALDDVARDASVKVIVVRLKRTRALDVTAAAILEATASNLRSQGRHLILVGMTPDLMQVLERSGAAAAIGADHLFPTQETWFSAMEAARQRALELCGECDEACPLRAVRFTAMTAVAPAA
jgi:SulP family sulfate permease